MAFSQASTNFTSGITNTTHSFTGNGLASVSATTNGIAFVFVESSTTDPTSVTWGGSGMTKLIGGVANSARGTTNSIWYILAPASGAITMVVNFASSTTMNQFWGIWDNTAQVAPEASTSGTTTATSITQNVTTITNNAWVVSFSSNSSGVPTAGTNTTGRMLQGIFGIGDTNGPVTPPASTSQQYTFGSSTTWTMFTVAIAPYSVASNKNPAFFFNFL